MKDTDLRLDSLDVTGGEEEDLCGCGELTGLVVPSLSEVLVLDFLGLLAIGVSMGISKGSFLFFSLTSVEGVPIGTAAGEGSSFAYLSFSPSFFQAGICFSATWVCGGMGTMVQLVAELLFSSDLEPVAVL